MLRLARIALAIGSAIVAATSPVVGQRPSASAPAPTSAGRPEPSAVSPRNANYSIDVDLDPRTRTLNARGVVSWRNITSRPTSELQFHLDWNAWRNTESTWMREAHGLGLRTSATMMFGHRETLADRVEHLRRLRELQDETGGFTAFIPWAFQPTHAMVRMEAAGSHDYLRTLAVSRLYLQSIPNLQSS